jgi:hypothetical protein
VGLGHLPVEEPGEHLVAELFEPIHHVLGEAAPMVAAVILPAISALGLDFLEDAISGMVVAPLNRALPGRNSDLGTAFGEGCVTAPSLS